MNKIADFRNNPLLKRAGCSFVIALCLMSASIAAQAGVTEFGAVGRIVQHYDSPVTFRDLRFDFLITDKFLDLNLSNNDIGLNMYLPNKTGLFSTGDYSGGAFIYTGDGGGYLHPFFQVEILEIEYRLGYDGNNAELLGKPDVLERLALNFVLWGDVRDITADNWTDQAYFRFNSDVPIPQLPMATPIPEPSSWAMLMVGLSLVGGAVAGRRGKRVS